MTAPATPSSVPAMLREYGQLTHSALQRYLPLQNPRPYLDELVSDYPRRPGKMLRPTLCIATACAFGARVEDVLDCAVSIELLHNALLIHDDVEDGSSERRGEPTLHELHGVPLAINAGDALTLLSMRPLIDNLGRFGSDLSFSILEETDLMARETAEGQALDIGWRRDNRTDIDAAAYLEMVLKKTCWFGMIYPCRLGALIATRGGVELEPFIRFGFFLGAAFQIQDDVLNLVDESDRYGKERDGDLWEGKRTLMLIRLFQESSPSERARLTEALKQGREDRDPTEVAWVRDLMDRYECIEYAREVAHGLAGAALHEFSIAFRGVPDSRDRHFVEGLATWVFERT